jgi:Uma2 family endonuclease
MSTIQISTFEPLVVHVGSTLSRLTAQQFEELCRLNPELRIECTATGDILIMPPTGGETGRRNASIVIELGVWNKADGRGIVFDSSTCFTLPNGAKRSPDASWVLRSRWDQLSGAEREKFPSLTPDFVVELRSPTDSLCELHDKLGEYIANGARLGWLIDPTSKTVWVYEGEGAPKQLDQPAELPGGVVLPGFVLKMDAVW